MAENKTEIMEVIMSLIMHGGDARSSTMEAIHAARHNDFNLAAEKLRGADAALSEAQKVQSTLLSQDASEEPVELNLHMVHAQDHMMNAMTYRDLAEEMVELYRRSPK